MALLDPPAPTVLETKKRHPSRRRKQEGDRRYGIVALTRTATRDELHPSRGRTGRAAESRGYSQPMYPLEPAYIAVRLDELATPSPILEVGAG